MTPSTAQPFDAIVLGGGAAGLFCAITAGRRGKRVLVLEHNERIGKKIAISGGGRCNFTNLHATPANYLSSNPDFCISALARYTPADFLALVEEHRIPFHEKKLGQQFCNDSSRRIIEMLLAECAGAGVTIHCGCRVDSVRKTDRFEVATRLGVFEAPALVVATGGLSFPRLGATDAGYRIATQFGLRLTELRPALVPLAFSPADHARYHELSGLSLPVTVRLGAARFDEAMLFTHRGLSGPAILQISSFWREGDRVTIDLLPSQPGSVWLGGARHSGAGIAGVLSRHLPKRLADAWSRAHASAKPLRHIADRDLDAFTHLLHDWPVEFPASEGYAKAEVTLGGVDTRDLSSKTMEARRVPGLFFIGEVVDVTGWLGGYNFQWAWASANAAGLAL